MYKKCQVCFRRTVCVCRQFLHQIFFELRQPVRNIWQRIVRIFLVIFCGGFGFLVCSCLQFLFEMGFVLVRHSAVGTSHWILSVENHRACVQKWDRGKDRRSGWNGWERTCAGGQCQVRERTRHHTWMTIVLGTKMCNPELCSSWATRVRVIKSFSPGNRNLS